MAEVGVLSDQDELFCSVCLDVLENPATVTCGHTFCMACINGHWDKEDQRGIYSCPQCRKTFNPRPDLHKNYFIDKMVEKLKKTDLQAASPAGSGKVECDFCTGRKLRAVKSCLTCLASFCETHLKPHYEVPALNKHKVVKASKQLQEKICSQHDKPIEIYCRTDNSPICYMCTMHEHKGHDTVAAVAERTQKQSFQTVRISSEPEDFSPSSISIYHKPSFDEVRKSLTDLKERLEQFCIKEFSKIPPQAGVSQTISDPEPRTRTDFLQYFCRLTLDPNTLNYNLHLSENKREVKFKQGNYCPDHPERFDAVHQVLSKESVCGRAYWEVECDDGVDIAVSYKGISRKEYYKSCFGHNDQSWSLYSLLPPKTWNNEIENKLSVQLSSRVGVYVDHSAGILSFYNISDTLTSMTMIHTVHTTFTQPLYAGLWIGCLSSAKLCDL